MFAILTELGRMANKHPDLWMGIWRLRKATDQPKGQSLEVVNQDLHL